MLSFNPITFPRTFSTMVNNKKARDGPDPWRKARSVPQDVCREVCTWSGYEEEGEGPTLHSEIKRRLVSILRKENGKYSYCLLQVGFVSQTFSLMGPGSYSVDFDNVWSSYPRSKERVTVLIMCIYRNLPWKPRALSLLINISNIIQKDTCTLMFKVALFTTDKTCKQSKCPSTDEWIKKMCAYVCVYVCVCIVVV